MHVCVCMFGTGNRGEPATPRDGAAVEIVGLVRSATRWLAELHAAGVYPYAGVRWHDGATLSYAEWSDRVVRAFERYFYVPTDAADDARYILEVGLVNRRVRFTSSSSTIRFDFVFVSFMQMICWQGIYKDSYGSSSGWTDYQLRPNFFVAMVVVRSNRNRSDRFVSIRLIVFLIVPLWW
jgi:glycogen debranching enzyme